MKDYGPALDAALAKECRDERRKYDARYAFHDVLMSTRDVHKALDSALNKAAHDGGSYESMHYTFWEVQSRRDATLWGRVVNGIEKIKEKVGLTGSTVLH